MAVPVAVIETERLLLRPLTLGDLDELAVLHAEEAFWRFPLGRGQTVDETRDFLVRQVGRYGTEPALSAAVERETGRLIGWLGLSAPHVLPQILPAVEVGWRIGQPWWGRGLATEGAAASVRFGFETLGLEELVSCYEPANTASGRVMDRLGFTLREVTRHPTLGFEVHVRSLGRSRWRALLDGGAWPAGS